MYIIDHISLHSSYNVWDENFTKNKPNFMFQNFFPKIVLFLRQCENYATARQGAEDTKMWRRRDAILLSNS